MKLSFFVCLLGLGNGIIALHVPGREPLRGNNTFDCECQPLSHELWLKLNRGRHRRRPLSVSLLSLVFQPL